MKKSYNLLSYFNMRSLFIGIGISKILANTHELHYLSVILGTIIGLLILRFVKIELKNNFINTIIASLFIMVSLVIIINMISTMYLTKMPKIFIGLPILLTLMYILKLKETTIYRLANILIILNILFYVFMIVTLVPNIDTFNLMYTGVSFKQVIITSFEFALFSTLPTFISRDKETADINIYKTYIISSITLGILMFIIYLIIGPNMADILRYPEYMVLKSINISDSITNLENMLSLVWVMNVIMFMLTCGNTIKKQVKNNKILDIILILLLIAVTLINKFYQIIISVYLYIIPFLIISLFLLFIVNKKKKVF